MIILHGLHILVLYKQISLVAVCLIRIHAKKSAGGHRDGESWQLSVIEGSELAQGIGQTSKVKSKDDQGPGWKANTSEINHEAIDASVCFCIERPDQHMRNKSRHLTRLKRFYFMQCNVMQCHAM